MEQLRAGYRRFLKDLFPERKSHYHLLAEGQAPGWLFITCSDSRVVPDLILGTEPGDLFITRNAGNVVPEPSHMNDGVTATIEYAVEVLGVQHAILCGHSDCGAMKAALDLRRGGNLERLPRASEWLRHVEGAFAHRQPINLAEGKGAELESLVRGNVVAQLKSLRAQPSVARAVAAGRLQVHGWYYQIMTGRIEEWDEEQGRFRALLEEERRGEE